MGWGWGGRRRCGASNLCSRAGHTASHFINHTLHSRRRVRCAVLLLLRRLRRLLLQKVHTAALDGKRRAAIRATGPAGKRATFFRKPTRRAAPRRGRCAARRCGHSGAGEPAPEGFTRGLNTPHVAPELRRALRHVRACLQQKTTSAVHKRRAGACASTGACSGAQAPRTRHTPPLIAPPRRHRRLCRRPWIPTITSASTWVASCATSGARCATSWTAARRRARCRRKVGHARHNRAWRARLARAFGSGGKGLIRV